MTILYDQPHLEYLEAPGISSGMLRLCAERTPLHVWAAYIDPEREHVETPAMLLGRALHTRFLLGGEAYDAEFAVAPKCDRRTKAGKELWANFTAENAGKQILKEDDSAKVLAMNEALHANKHIEALVNPSAKREISCFHGDKKCRFDFLSTMVGDLKTTSDISKHGVSRDIAKYGYHIQAAWYLDMAAALDLPHEPNVFPLVLVENHAPYDTAVRVIGKDAIERGREIIRRVYPILQHAFKADDWPGFAAEDPQFVELPIYAMSDEE